MIFYKDILPELVDKAIKEEPIDIDELCKQIEKCDNLRYSTIYMSTPYTMSFDIYNKKHWRYEPFYIHYNEENIITRIEMCYYKTPIYEKGVKVNRSVLNRRLKNY